MEQHRDGQRRNPALGRLRNRGRGAAIDDTGGQVPEQVDDLRPGGLLDQPGVARTDALDTADLGEQWEQQLGAHGCRMSNSVAGRSGYGRSTVQVLYTTARSCRDGGQQVDALARVDRKCTRMASRPE